MRAAVKPIDLSGMSPVPDARAAYLGFHKRLPDPEPQVWARPATWEEIPSAARWAVAYAVTEDRWWVTYARGTPDPFDLRRECSTCGKWCRLTEAGRLYKHDVAKRPCDGGGSAPVGPAVAPVVSSVVVRCVEWSAIWEGGEFREARAGGRGRTSTELRAWLSNRSLVGSES
jgi:hypothetical protein